MVERQDPVERGALAPRCPKHGTAFGRECNMVGRRAEAARPTILTNVGALNSYLHCNPFPMKKDGPLVKVRPFILWAPSGPDIPPEPW